MSGFVFCTRCGSQNPPDHRFCWSCGTPLTSFGAMTPPAAFPIPPPPGAWPAPETVQRPSNERTLLIVVLVLVVLLVIAGIGITLLVAPLVNPVPSTNPVRTIGVLVARSSDGTNWTLTFTSVPNGLTPSATRLALMSSSGSIVLGPKALALLSYSTDRVAYFQSAPGSSVGVGDRLLISTVTYPTGYTYQISDTSSIFASGTLG